MALRLPGRDRRDLRYRVALGVTTALAALILRALGATWRVRIEGEDPFARPEPVLGAVWHEAFLVAAFAWRGRGVAVPVSRSRDGDLIDAVLRRLGFARGPRGSSSRGGSAALRAMIRCVQSGVPLGVLPDGPRGPARRSKYGVLAAARATGAPIVPVGISAWPARRLGSWDRSLLPLPFARVVCRYGEPLRVPKEASEPELERLRGALDEALDSTTAAAAARLGVAANPPPRALGGAPPGREGGA